MKGTRVAARYSKAFLDLSLELNKLEEAKVDAEVVFNAINTSRDLRNFLGSPVVKPLQKNKILSEIFEKNISELTMRFILLIVRHGRDKVQYREHMNIVEVEFTTSTKVTANVVANIKKMLESSTGKTIEIVETVDEKLIGGYIVDMANYRLDASLANGMRKLRRELVK